MKRAITAVLLAASVSAGCASSRIVVTRAEGAPRLPPTARVAVVREAPPGAIEIAKLVPKKFFGAPEGDGCKLLVLSYAQKMGASLLVLSSGADGYCSGVAYVEADYVARLTAPQ